MILSASWTPQIKNADKFDIDPELKENIISTEKGSYNDVLPIFALNIEILSADENKITYKTRYFPFGVTETEYSKDETGWIFNLVKKVKD